MGKSALWQPLKRFRDPTVPKLDNLRRAARAGLRVPPTWWAWAADAPTEAPRSIGEGPLIIRSGSPTEDTRETSNAGQLLSLTVQDGAEFGTALRQVVDVLPKDANGQPRGAVFVQPLVEAIEAGVCFFDGFYYERTAATGGNSELTAGQARGEVTRGTVTRGEPWSEWLTAIHTVFGVEGRLDIEWARDGMGIVLLQVRPALFPIVRNPTLSLANHKEILGDPPSPWTVSVLDSAGRDVLGFFARVDPAVQDWDETYAIVLAERAWMNFSFFFRLMDRWGLPRTFVTQGVGGERGGQADGRLLPRRFLRAIPRLMRLQWLCLRTVAQAGRALNKLDGQLETAQGLTGLFAVNVAGMALAIQTNFALSGVLSGVSRVRRLLRIPGAARLVTQEMMQGYALLSQDPDTRGEELDAWLTRFGHRGPLESDVARPRFAEMRSTLAGDVVQEVPGPKQAGAGRGAVMFRAWFVFDERREWFRDALMRRWQRLRQRILEEAALLVDTDALDAVEDVFWLVKADLTSERPLREAVRAARERTVKAGKLRLPLTGTRQAIEHAMAQVDTAGAAPEERRVFPGIALGPTVVEGVVVKADDLVALLTEQGQSKLGANTILVVPSLEPSWAVVFPRVGGVIAEIGGELSHASILLREARKPTLVNCAGIWDGVETGDRLRLDGARARAEKLN